jgi:hypothetical protein
MRFSTFHVQAIFGSNSEISLSNPKVRIRASNYKRIQAKMFNMFLYWSYADDD